MGLSLPEPPPPAKRLSQGQLRRALKGTQRRMAATVYYGRLYQLGVIDEGELNVRLARIRAGALR